MAWGALGRARGGGGGTRGPMCGRLLSPDSVLRGPALGPSRAALGKGRSRDCCSVSLAVYGGWAGGGEGGERGCQGAASRVRGEEGPSPPERTWLFPAAAFRGRFGWADA